MYAKPGPLAARKAAAARRREQENADLALAFQAEQDEVARRRHLAAVRAMAQVAGATVKVAKGPKRDAKGRFLPKVSA